MSSHHPNINCNNNDLLLILETSFMTLMPFHVNVGRTIFDYRKLIENHLKSLNQNTSSIELRYHISTCLSWINVFDSLVFYE